MKPQYILLLLSLSVTGGAALYQGDATAPAEKVFKNIKTMTGTPANEVIPAMKFMSASLKVDCDFCHKGQDFASDEKQAKAAARHMIEMQKDINAKNFNGRVQVTCNTCHNGSPNPQRVPAVAGLNRRTINRSGTALVVADVLKKYHTAIGGELKAVTLEGSIVGLRPATMPVKYTQGAPDHFMTSMGEGPGISNMGFDGTACWYQAGGQTQILPAANAEELKDFGRFYRDEKAFDHMGPMRFAGRDKVNGVDVVVLRAGAQKAMISRDLYFDEKTGLLTRIASYTSTVLGSLAETEDFSDYRKIAGTMVPFRIARTGTKESSVITVKKATPNPTLPTGFFSPPKK